MPKGKYERKIIPAKERLLARIMPITECGCWIFEGCLNAKGYGDFCISGNEHRLAHRVSYEIFKGPIPKGAFVLHSCDIPSCVNPDHLRVGTQRDNMQDCIRRGRNGTAGVKNEFSKLTDEAVKEIRASSASLSVLAAKFNVAISSISQVRNWKTWKHVKTDSPLGMATLRA